jgi:hypothetical protein
MSFIRFETIETFRNLDEHFASCAGLDTELRFIYDYIKEVVQVRGKQEIGIGVSLQRGRVLFDLVNHYPTDLLLASLLLLLVDPTPTVS